MQSFSSSNSQSSNGKNTSPSRASHPGAPSRASHSGAPSRASHSGAPQFALATVKQELPDTLRSILRELAKLRICHNCVRMHRNKLRRQLEQMNKEQLQYAEMNTLQEELTDLVDDLWRLTEDFLELINPQLEKIEYDKLNDDDKKLLQNYVPYLENSRVPKPSANHDLKSSSVRQNAANSVPIDGQLMYSPDDKSAVSCVEPTEVQIEQEVERLTKAIQSKKIRGQSYPLPPNFRERVRQGMIQRSQIPAILLPSKENNAASSDNKPSPQQLEAKLIQQQLEAKLVDRLQVGLEEEMGDKPETFDEALAIAQSRISGKPPKSKRKPKAVAGQGEEVIEPVKSKELSLEALLEQAAAIKKKAILKIKEVEAREKVQLPIETVAGEAKMSASGETEFAQMTGKTRRQLRKRPTRQAGPEVGQEEIASQSRKRKADALAVPPTPAQASGAAMQPNVAAQQSATPSKVKVIDLTLDEDSADESATLSVQTPAAKTPAAKKRRVILPSGASSAVSAQQVVADANPFRLDTTPQNPLASHPSQLRQINVAEIKNQASKQTTVSLIQQLFPKNNASGASSSSSSRGREVKGARIASDEMMEISFEQFLKLTYEQQMLLACKLIQDRNTMVRDRLRARTGLQDPVMSTPGSDNTGRRASVLDRVNRLMELENNPATPSSHSNLSSAALAVPARQRALSVPPVTPVMMQVNAGTVNIHQVTHHFSSGLGASAQGSPAGHSSGLSLPTGSPAGQQSELTLPAGSSGDQLGLNLPVGSVPARPDFNFAMDASADGPAPSKLRS